MGDYCGVPTERLTSRAVVRSGLHVGRSRCRYRRDPGRTGYHHGGQEGDRQRERPHRYHRDVPPHHFRTRGRRHRPAARPDRGAAEPERPDGQPDGRPDAARRIARRFRRPAPGTDRPRPRSGHRRDAQAPAGRAAAAGRHRARLAGRARRGLPLGTRDERAGRAAADRAARAPADLAVRQPDPGSGRPRRIGPARSPRPTAT